LIVLLVASQIDDQEGHLCEVKKDIYGIYGSERSKQIRFVSGLAIDDKSLTNAAGAGHHVLLRPAAVIALTCNDIYGIYASDGSKQISFVSNLAIDDETPSPMLPAFAITAPSVRGCIPRRAMTSMESMDLKETKNAFGPIR
jgi:hypothetical protein